MSKTQKNFTFKVKLLEPLQSKEVDSHQEQDTNSDALLFCCSPANQLAYASSFTK